MEKTTKPVRIDFPRLYFRPMQKHCCVIACLVAVARFFGKEFDDQILEEMFELTEEQRGLDDETLNDWLLHLGITAERHVNCTLDDIRKALKNKVPCAVGYQVNHAPSSWHVKMNVAHMAMTIGLNKKYILLADGIYRYGQVPFAKPLKEFEEAWWDGEREPVMGLTIYDPEKIERCTLITFHSKKTSGRSYESIWSNIKATDKKFAEIEKKEKKAWQRRRMKLDEGITLDTLEIDWDLANKALEETKAAEKPEDGLGV